MKVYDHDTQAQIKKSSAKELTSVYKPSKHNIQNSEGCKYFLKQTSCMFTKAINEIKQQTKEITIE